MTANKIYHMTYIAVFTVLISICSWITIPMVVPFTMQTFAIFFTVAMLGGKLGTLTILVYVLLGCIGIPVFHGFQGGIGVLLSNTGGYVIGFIFSSLLMWGIEKMFGRKPRILALSMILGLIVCYTFGTVWFMVHYTNTCGMIRLLTAIGWCVSPFIIPDIIKIFFVFTLYKRLPASIKSKLKN